MLLSLLFPEQYFNQRHREEEKEEEEEKEMGLHHTHKEFLQKWEILHLKWAHGEADVNNVVEQQQKNRGTSS